MFGTQAFLNYISIPLKTKCYFYNDTGGNNFRYLAV